MKKSPIFVVLQATIALVLSWPAPTLTFAVQKNFSLSTSNWQTPTNAPVVVSSKNQLTIPKRQTMMFYRLVLQ